ncbi:hypothetical protein DXG01_003679 [Tephrocybe rancida]|nr:hypothetical protein DXG01_003679 [Tephrocybe rancida]
MAEEAVVTRTLPNGLSPPVITNVIPVAPIVTTVVLNSVVEDEKDVDVDDSPARTQSHSSVPVVAAPPPRCQREPFPLPPTVQLVIPISQSRHFPPSLIQAVQLRAPPPAHLPLQPISQQAKTEIVEHTVPSLLPGIVQHLVLPKVNGHAPPPRPFLERIGRLATPEPDIETWGRAWISKIPTVQERLGPEEEKWG